MSQKPSQTGRIVVAAAVVAAFALALILFASSPAPVDHERGPYWGARILPPGPAWTGAPAIPVAEGPDGLVGVPTHLDWLRFGEWHTKPGLSSDYDGTETLVYHADPGFVAYLETARVQPWWLPLLGQPVQASHFTADWQGAPAAWRSAGAEGRQTLPVIVIRAEEGAYPAPFETGFARDGFVAFAAEDSRNGCILQYDVSKNARALLADGHPLLFDSCHDSRYDPRDVRQYDLDSLRENCGFRPCA